MTMIQHSEFHDGCFVLHKIMLNGHKYSAWYGRDGVMFSAELVFQNGNTRNVTERQHEVWKQLTKVGSRYVKASV
jgi:hypothetical protein